jgi:hypothetical protein
MKERELEQAELEPLGVSTVAAEGGEDDEDVDDAGDSSEDDDIVNGKQARPYHAWGKGSAVGVKGKSWWAAYKVLQGADFLGEVRLLPSLHTDFCLHCNSIPPFLCTQARDFLIHRTPHTALLHNSAPLRRITPSPHYTIAAIAKKNCQVFADFFGLTSSKYQYVVDAYERHEREQEMEAAHEQSMQRLNELERDEMEAAELAREGEATDALEAGRINMASNEEETAV